MKPRNFPQRKERRRRVAQGMLAPGATYPMGDLRPKDIRLRRKAFGKTIFDKKGNPL